MAIPYLPSSLINPTYTCLQMPSLDTSDLNMIKLQKLKKYFKKRWLSQIEPGELSVYSLNIATNNAAESYHSKIKSLVRTCHPRIWTFIATLNYIIQDTDDIGRLQRGLEISRPRKKRDLQNFELRRIIKRKLSDGEFNPWQYLKAISHTIGMVNTDINIPSSESEDSDEEDTPVEENKCVVCPESRNSTWIFLPCRHANCCPDCSQRIQVLGQSCLTCRANIDEMFPIFTN